MLSLMLSGDLAPLVVQLLDPSHVRLQRGVVLLQGRLAAPPSSTFAQAACLVACFVCSSRTISASSSLRRCGIGPSAGRPPAPARHLHMPLSRHPGRMRRSCRCSKSREASLRGPCGIEAEASVRLLSVGPHSAAKRRCPSLVLGSLHRARSPPWTPVPEGAHARRGRPHRDVLRGLDRRRLGRLCLILHRDRLEHGRGDVDAHCVAATIGSAAPPAWACDGA